MKIIKHTLLIFLAFFTVLSLPRRGFSEGTWQQVKLPFESEWTMQVVWLYDPLSQSMYMGQDKKGLYQSKDGGESWIRADNGSFQVEDTNNDSFSLVADKFGSFFSLVSDRKGTRIFSSSDQGAHWNPLWPKSDEEVSKIWNEKKVTPGWSKRLWINPNDSNDMHLLTWKGGTDESPDIWYSIWNTKDNWKSFETFDFSEKGQQFLSASPNANACSLVNGKLMCIWDGLKEFEPLKGFDSGENYTGLFSGTDGSLVVACSKGIFHSQGNTLPFQKIAALPTNTRDIVVHPKSIFPIFLAADSDSSARQLFIISDSGKTTSYSGPDEQFRLSAVDFDHQTVFVWTTKGLYKMKVQ